MRMKMKSTFHSQKTKSRSDHFPIDQCAAEVALVMDQGLHKVWGYLCPATGNGPGLIEDLNCAELVSEGGEIPDFDR